MQIISPTDRTMELKKGTAMISLNGTFIARDLNGEVIAHHMSY